MDQITIEIDGDEIVVRFNSKEGRYLTVKAALDQARVWLEGQQARLGLEVR